MTLCFQKFSEDASFIYFIYSLFTVDKFTIKIDIILYTNKNSNFLIIKIKHANSCQLPNKSFLKLKF